MPYWPQTKDKSTIVKIRVIIKEILVTKSQHFSRAKKKEKKVATFPFEAILTTHTLRSCPHKQHALISPSTLATSSHGAFIFSQ